MTETIGWGDVDIDVAPPRHRRLRRVLLWPAVLAVVAGVALAPSARAKLAGNAVGWLGRQWAIAKAYDANRTSLEAAALQRVAAADRPLYAHLVTLLDWEEAARLRTIARAVGGHRSWTGDVHAAAAAVRRALLAEAHDLDGDAGHTTATFGTDVFLETPTQAATQNLLLDADRSVTQAARRHHVRLNTRLRPADGQLRSAASVLATLRRLTNHPLDLHIALSHDGSLDMWDLATGRVKTDLADARHFSDFLQPLMRLGDGALFMSDHGPQLIGTDGSSTRLALPTHAQYFPAGDGTLWVATLGTWRHYDGAGRPDGPAYRTPAGYSNGAIAASGRSVVLALDSPEPGTRSVLWTPSTGRLVPLPGACDAAIVGSRDAIAYVSCDQVSLSVMDMRTGHRRTVVTPPGTVVDEVAMALSPDGRRLAFRASPLNGEDVNGTLMVLDTRTGAMTDISGATLPLSWSADGKTLLVSSDVGENAYSLPYAYWNEGMAHPEPIRIPVTGQSDYAILLP